MSQESSPELFAQSPRPRPPVPKLPAPISPAGGRRYGFRDRAKIKKPFKLREAGGAEEEKKGGAEKVGPETKEPESGSGITFPETPALSPLKGNELRTPSPEPRVSLPKGKPLAKASNAEKRDGRRNARKRVEDLSRRAQLQQPRKLGPRWWNPTKTNCARKSRA